MDNVMTKCKAILMIIYTRQF